MDWTHRDAPACATTSTLMDLAGVTAPPSTSCSRRRPSTSSSTSAAGQGHFSAGAWCTPFERACGPPDRPPTGARPAGRVVAITVADPALGRRTPGWRTQRGLDDICAMAGLAAGNPAGLFEVHHPRPPTRVGFCWPGVVTSHALVLRTWAMAEPGVNRQKPALSLPHALITLVSRSSSALYSGMVFACLIAGFYAPGGLQALIAPANCAQAGVSSFLAA